MPIALLYWHSGPAVRGVLILVATLLPMLTSNVVRTFAWIVILGRNGPDQPDRCSRWVCRTGRQS